MTSFNFSQGLGPMAWDGAEDIPDNLTTLPPDRIMDKVLVLATDEDLVSEAGLWVFSLVNFWGVGQCVTILGIVNNVLNIVIFLKQGVKDTVNISLLNLAISDLGSLLFLLTWNILSTPSFSALDLPFYPEQIRWHVGWVHVILIRVSTGITALITFERCLCIAIPLDVKRILTPDRAVKSIIAIYVVMTGSAAPMFYTSRYVWTFDPARNKSILGLIYLKNRGDQEVIVFVMNAVLPTVTFVFIVVCTAILVKTLREKSKWRQTTARSNISNMSDKETKAVKMVVFISVVFILCFLPGIFVFIWTLLDPELRPDGKQIRTMYAVTSVMLFMEGVNAAANFFVYLLMSSKFKITAREMFCRKCRPKS